MVTSSSTQPGTQQFQITQLLTTNIDPLDFASAEGAPDLLISLIVDHREVWLFGETSTEVFFNSGNADFPLERIQGAFIQQGCAAKNTPARFGGSVVWLTANEQGQGMVVKAQGYQPVRISTHAVEYAINQYASIDDAIGFSYQCEGHSFYVLTFPTAQRDLGVRRQHAVVARASVAQPSGRLVQPTPRAVPGGVSRARSSSETGRILICYVWDSRHLHRRRRHSPRHSPSPARSLRGQLLAVLSQAVDRHGDRRRI
jgi:hypothetical protein